MYLTGYLIGVVLGIIFFGGLYLSIKMLARYKQSGLYMVVLSLVRMTILVLGFYLLSRFGPLVMFFALLGVMSVRIYMVRREKTKLALDKRKELDHEH